MNHVIHLINNNNSNTSLCLSREGFIVLLTLQNIFPQMEPEQTKYYQQIKAIFNIFINVIRSKAVLFYGVSPNDKSNWLISIKKTKEYHNNVW